MEYFLLGLYWWVCFMAGWWYFWHHGPWSNADERAMGSLAIGIVVMPFLWPLVCCFWFKAAKEKQAKEYAALRKKLGIQD